MRKFVSQALLVATVLIAAVSFLFLPGATMAALASSHREAPLIVGDPLADNTDVYAFRSYEPGREGYVTLLWNHVPIEFPSGGPQFYPFGNDVLYDIKVDNTGDGVDDLIYRFTFQTQVANPDSVLGMTTQNQDGIISSLTDPDYNQSQRYMVTKMRFLPFGIVQRQVIGKGLIVPPNNIGNFATPNYETLAAQAIYSLPSGERVFAGQRAEGFYLDLGGVFDNLRLRSLGDTGGINSTAGASVNTLAIEIPIQDLTRNGKVPTSSTDRAAVIGVYSTASRCAVKTAADGYCSKPIQVSRLGSPLVNELVIPLRLKDRFNASDPQNDTQFASFIANPQLAQLLQTIYQITIPPTPRQDLVNIFATGIPPGSLSDAPDFTTQLTDGKPHELLRLNLAIPPVPLAQQNRLGILAGDLAGFPNGRRVNDDVVDIELRAVAGGTPFTPDTNIPPNNVLGDGVSQPGVPFLGYFPYLGTPISGNPPVSGT
jgi:hypothetical protein